jgi:hypothetical protein
MSGADKDYIPMFSRTNFFLAVLRLNNKVIFNPTKHKTWVSIWHETALGEKWINGKVYYTITITYSNKKYLILASRTIGWITSCSQERLNNILNPHSVLKNFSRSGGFWGPGKILKPKVSGSGIGHSCILGDILQWYLCIFNFKIVRKDLHEYFLCSIIFPGCNGARILFCYPPPLLP